MKKITFIVLAFATGFEVFSQDIDSMACKLVDVFREKDTASIPAMCLMPDDTPYIIQKKMEAEGIVSTQTPKSDAYLDTALITYKNKINEAFLQLRKKAAELGLDWSKARCNNYSFAIQLNPAEGLPTAHGQIIIASGVKTFEIALKSLIKINGRWKIIDIDIVQK
ncbi:MAG TPA: hypothetical protein VFZ42_17640 [Chitinophagaceae bacterium]